MSIDIRVPTLPESVADATVLSWHKQPGDAVTRDENLVDLETDKVVLEVPAPADGVLTEIQFDEGDTVEADQVLAIIDENARAAAETRIVVIQPANRLPENGAIASQRYLWATRTKKKKQNVAPRTAVTMLLRRRRISSVVRGLLSVVR